MGEFFSYKTLLFSVSMIYSNVLLGSVITLPSADKAAELAALQRVKHENRERKTVKMDVLTDIRQSIQSGRCYDRYYVSNTRVWEALMSSKIVEELRSIGYTVRIEDENRADYRNLYTSWC